MAARITYRLFSTVVEGAGCQFFPEEAPQLHRNCLGQKPKHHWVKGYKSLCRSGTLGNLLYRQAERSWISCLLLLAAAEAGARSVEDMSALTHLPVKTMADLTELVIEALWLDSRLRLTPLGRRELEQLRSVGDEFRLFPPTRTPSIIRRAEGSVKGIRSAP